MVTLARIDAISERTGFKIPDLDQWILVPANQRQVLWHLLVLVADWTRSGAPRHPGLTMRQFTPGLRRSAGSWPITA